MRCLGELFSQIHGSAGSAAGKQPLRRAAFQPPYGGQAAHRHEWGRCHLNHAPFLHPPPAHQGTTRMRKKRAPEAALVETSLKVSLVAMAVRGKLAPA